MAKNMTTEKGRYKKIRESLRQFNGLRLDVGYFAGTESASPSFTLPEIAAVQEYGTRDGRVPERSFMRTTFDKFRNVYTQAFIDGGYDVLLGKLSPITALKRVGEDYKSDLVNKITGIRSPKNAPSTIAKKGFDNPLIETGLMRSSIKIRVLKKGVS